MVELRKRPPPKEPAAPAPAAKKRASSKSKEPATKAESSSGSGIASKAKAAATKVKKAVSGPVATGESKAPEQPEASEAAVETGEAGLIPETAGTAPDTTTVPAPAPAPEASETSRPPATEDLENPPEKGAVDTTAAGSSTSGAPATFPLSEASIGQTLSPSSLPSASLQTHTGRSLNPSELLGTGKGTIIFTYPKASTPGCTQQVCLFRDNHETFSGPTNGYTVYGLSTDSVKANANFATKQKIQYELICDPEAVLTGALGLKKPGNAKGTLRGVVVIDAEGVVKVWLQAGPAKTVEIVKEFLQAK